ncbi:MAG: protein kinase [bacterium]
MAPKQPNLRPGDVVAGRFRIVEMIGSGGFSVVYRAHQEDMNRFVALKVLKPTASHDAKIVERFRREALYASHLTHPNTITLFDYGHTDDGLCYIAMEFLLGHDLSAVVQRHIPMDLKRVWRILIQCCRSSLRPTASVWSIATSSPKTFSCANATTASSSKCSTLECPRRSPTLGMRAQTPWPR